MYPRKPIRVEPLEDRTAPATLITGNPDGDSTVRLWDTSELAGPIGDPARVQPEGDSAGVGAASLAQQRGLTVRDAFAAFPEAYLGGIFVG